ncbi:MAG: PD40 domain-containing protein [Acidobacteria bacterium]|nr:PD40 domain-containing protein [Acidobacteriota bacterium]
MLFGSFEADLASGELRKAGVRVKLPEQSFKVLEVLLEQPGAIVSREELQKRVWTPDTHVGFERSLNTIVHTLRSALGDSARNPRFIETVHGRGYRLLTSVRAAALAGEAATASNRTPAPRRKPAALWLLAGSAAMVLLASVLFWRAAEATNGRPESAPLVLPSPVTSYVGMEAGPDFSPDGSMIAFHWNKTPGGTFDIYYKHLGEEAAQQLTTDPADDTNPAWSPDGRQLAFLRRRPQYKASVMLVGLDGGPERQLTTIDANDGSLSWSRDGRWIAFDNAYPDYLRHHTNEAGIMAVEVASGRRVTITRPPPLSLGDFSPRFSPRGGRLAFIRGVSASSGDIHLVDIDENLQPKGAPRQVTFDGASISSLAWSPEGDRLYFASERSNQSSAQTLWRLDVTKEGAEPVSLGPSRASGLTVSPTTGEVVFVHPVGSENLWRLRVEPGKPAEASRITHSTSVNRQPALSSDGSELLFESSRTGFREIWTSKVNGEDPRQVSFLNGPSAGTPQWSPDGGKIVLDARLDGSGDVFVLDLADGVHRRLTEHRGDDIVPSWSRDGRWIYFASNRTGRYEIWKMAPEGGEAVQITRQGGFHARESVDGQTLFYAKSVTETSLWSVPVGGGAEQEVLGSLGEWSNFAPVETGVYYFAPPVERRTALLFHDFASGKSRRIYEADAWLNGGLSADRSGRVVIFAQPEPPQADLMSLSLPAF